MLKPFGKSIGLSADSSFAPANERRGYFVSTSLIGRM